MKTFTTKLQEEMERELQLVAAESGELLQRAQGSFMIVKEALQKLKEYIHETGFRNKDEEIAFFKQIKPGFHKELIYWAELMYIETNKPAGNKKILKEYYAKVLEYINIYFKRNQLLYTYYKMGHTSKDELLFMRETNCVPLLPEYNVDLDSNFCTVNSSKLAKILAFEDVYQFICVTLESLTGNVQSNDEKRSALVWTGTKAQFIEFCYALQSTGVLNNGKATVKDVFEFLMYSFNIKVSNYYSYFQSMRLRKKQRVPFIKMMEDYTIRRMDESDEFPRFS